MLPTHYARGVQAPERELEAFSRRTLAPPQNEGTPFCSNTPGVHSILSIRRNITYNHQYTQETLYAQYNYIPVVHVYILHVGTQFILQ